MGHRAFAPGGTRRFRRQPGVQVPIELCRFQCARVARGRGGAVVEFSACVAARLWEGPTAPMASVENRRLPDALVIVCAHDV